MAVMTVMPLPLSARAESEHDNEQDKVHASASAELSSEGVSQLDHHSEEDRLTEAQKNERVKQQLQVRAWKWQPELKSGHMTTFYK